MVKVTCSSQKKLIGGADSFSNQPILAVMYLVIMVHCLSTVLLALLGTAGLLLLALSSIIVKTLFCHCQVDCE